jgi:hypothetical protein
MNKEYEVRYINKQQNKGDLTVIAKDVKDAIKVALNKIHGSDTIRVTHVYPISEDIKTYDQ